MKFYYHNGPQSTVPHTAGADIAAGDLAAIGTNGVGVALSPIANGETGALCISGVFKVKRTGIFAAVNAGVKVYLNAGALSFSAGKHIGQTVTAAGSTAAATDEQEFLVNVAPEGVTV